MGSILGVWLMSDPLSQSIKSYDELLRAYTPCPVCGSDMVEPWKHPVGIKDKRVVCHNCSRVFTLNYDCSTPKETQSDE